MKIKSRIISLLTALALSSGIVSCASEETDVMDETALLLDHELFNTVTDSDQSDILGTVTLTYKVTPVLVDSVRFYAPYDEYERNMQSPRELKTVPLNYFRNGNTGPYEVFFTYQNVTVKYRTDNISKYPTDSDSIQLEIEVNKHAENTIKLVSCDIFDAGDGEQALRITVIITSDEGGSIHKYLVDFIAILDGNKVIIRDMSHVIE